MMPDPMIECARCALLMNAEDAEFCWYCEARLCFVCWDAYGHCGHSEADQQNEQARAFAEARSGAS